MTPKTIQNNCKIYKNEYMKAKSWISVRSFLP